MSRWKGVFDADPMEVQKRLKWIFSCTESQNIEWEDHFIELFH